MNRWVRAGLPALAVAVAVGLALTDWPFAWHFWVDHPLVAAFGAGLALLLVAGAVIDAHIQRREAHRWHGLGLVAAGEFASILYDLGITMAALTGADSEYRLRAEVEFHLATVRDRAGSLLSQDADPRDEVDVDDEVERLAVLVADGHWRGGCSQTLRVARGHLVDAVSRWAGTFAILNDDEQFNRVGRTVMIMDLITALHMSLVAMASADEDAPLDPDAFSTFARHWAELVDSINMDLEFWNERRRVGSRVELPALAQPVPAAG